MESDGAAWHGKVAPVVSTSSISARGALEATHRRCLRASCRCYSRQALVYMYTEARSPRVQAAESEITLGRCQAERHVVATVLVVAHTASCIDRNNNLRYLGRAGGCGMSPTHAFTCTNCHALTVMRPFASGNKAWNAMDILLPRRVYMCTRLPCIMSVRVHVFSRLCELMPVRIHKYVSGLHLHRRLRFFTGVRSCVSACVACAGEHRHHRDLVGPRAHRESGSAMRSVHRRRAGLLHRARRC